MKALRLVEGADFAPEALKVIFAAFDAAWQNGRAMNTEQVIDYALVSSVPRTGGGPEGA